MQRYSTVIAAALAGACIGGLAAQGMHAQAKGPSAYYIVEIDVTNEDVFNKQWIPKADETIKAAGGTYLVRSANCPPLGPRAPVCALHENVPEPELPPQAAYTSPLMTVGLVNLTPVAPVAVPGRLSPETEVD